MLSKLKSRYVLIPGAAIIAMALVFISTYDWGGDTRESRNVVLRSIPQSRPTAPITTLPPVSAPNVAADETEDVTVKTPEPAKEITYEVAETAFLEKRYGEAADLFSQYTDRKSENPWGYYMLGLSAWKAGDDNAAEHAFNRAIELDTRHVKSYINLSRVLLETSRPAEALEHIDEALTIDPESNAAHRLRGVAFSQLERDEEAIAAFRRAVQIDKQDAWSMNNMGLIFIDQGRYEDALPPLARAVELRDDVAVFYNNLGMALERVGHFRAAEDAYRLAVAANGAHEKAQDNLLRIEVVLEDGVLETVDLAALALVFVEEIDSWVVASVDDESKLGSEPQSANVVTTGADAGDTGSTDAGVSEPDSTGDGRNQ